MDKEKIKKKPAVAESGIIVMGGRLNKGKDGKWRSSSFNEGDKFGVVGDRLRIFASYYLHLSNPSLVFITAGGLGQLKGVPGVPTLAEEYKNELVELGVPGRKIIEEKKSNNTYQQLRNSLALAVSKNFVNIGIISNRYHLPRIKAMVDCGPGLKKFAKSLNIKYLSAEKIVLKFENVHWQDEISKAYSGQAMKERIALERKGIKNIKEGKYKFKFK